MAAKSAAKTLASKLASCQALQELRFVLSPVSSGSSGVRELLQSSYVDLKKENPNLPILVREQAEAGASVVARFPLGEERKVVLENCKREEVIAKVQDLLG
jgi:NADH dehydrogenase (ubiquinone) 1 alpha subcomplex subunit 2